MRVHNSSLSQFSPLQQATLRTLAYGQVFSHVPRFSQFCRLLISSHSFSQSELRSEYLWWTQRFGLAPSIYSVEQWRPLVREIWVIQRLLSWIPWVEAAWVTGSVAAGNVRENDDIDLLVLTAPNRLWLTRLLVVIWSVAAGKYRPRLISGGPAVKNKWCWNLWLEPSSLGVYGHPSVYVARELMQAKMIFRRQSVSSTILLDSATWTSKFLASAWKNRRKPVSQVFLSPTHSDAFLFDIIFSLVNSAAFFLQRWYMRPHQTWEKVTKKSAWFHPQVLAQRVQTRYETILAHWSDMNQFLQNFTWPEDWNSLERADLARAATLCQEARENGKKVVIATGVFDLFHEEHQAFLSAAAEQGDLLVVGLESDLRAKQLKGPDRPRQPQAQRQEQVQNYPVVTAAFILPEAFSAPHHHRALVALLQPSVLAVSSHSPHQDKKAKLLAEFGGELRVVREHNPLVSTTQLLSVQ